MTQYLVTFTAKPGVISDLRPLKVTLENRISRALTASGLTAEHSEGKKIISDAVSTFQSQHRHLLSSISVSYDDTDVISQTDGGTPKEGGVASGGGGGSMSGAQIVEAIDERLGPDNWREPTYENSVSYFDGNPPETPIEEMILAHNSNVDDGYVPLSLPFPFIWGGIAYNTIFIMSNGGFSFDEGVAAYNGNGTLPSSVDSNGAVLISSADNSIQRIYYKDDGGDTMRIRVEGNNTAGGDPGDPGMVYELVLYADTENEALVSIILNNRPERDHPGNTGIVAHKEWADQWENPVLPGDKLLFKYEGEAPAKPRAGNLNVKEVIENTISMFDQDFYWPLDEVAGRTFKEVHAARNDPEESLVLRGYGTVHANGPSAVNDGKGGVQLSGGKLIADMNNGLWPYKGREYTLFFFFQFTAKYDYLNIQVAGNEGRLFEINIYDDSVNAILYNDDDQYMLFLDAPIESFRAPTSGIAHMRITSQGDLLFGINENIWKMSRVMATGNAPNLPTGPAIDKDSNFPYGLRIEGGEDSPTISHVFISGNHRSDSDMLELIQGFGLSRGPIQLTNLNDGTPLGKGQLVDSVPMINSTIPGIYRHWRFDDAIISNALTVNSVDNPLKVDNGTWVAGASSPCPDGQSCFYIDADEVNNIHFDQDLWHAAEPNGLVVGFLLETHLTEDLKFSLELKHTDQNDRVWRRLSFNINSSGSMFVRIFGDDGNSAIIDMRKATPFKKGSRYFVLIAQYNNVMVTYINGTRVLINGSSGDVCNYNHILDGEDPPNSSIRPNEPSLFIAGKCKIAHLFFSNFAQPVGGDSSILLTQNLLFNPDWFGTSGTFSFDGDRSITVINGIITNYSSP